MKRPLASRWPLVKSIGQKQQRKIPIMAAATTQRTMTRTRICWFIVVNETLQGQSEDKSGWPQAKRGEVEVQSFLNNEWACTTEAGKSKSALCVAVAATERLRRCLMACNMMKVAHRSHRNE